jgi:hypothetical protein
MLALEMKLSSSSELDPPAAPELESPPPPTPLALLEQASSSQQSPSCRASPVPRRADKVAEVMQAANAADRTPARGRQSKDVLFLYFVLFIIAVDHMEKTITQTQITQTWVKG